jgi:hypothetical protein
MGSGDHRPTATCRAALRGGGSRSTSTETKTRMATRSSTRPTVVRRSARTTTMSSRTSRRRTRTAMCSSVRACGTTGRSSRPPTRHTGSRRRTSRHHRGRLRRLPRLRLPVRLNHDAALGGPSARPARPLQLLLVRTGAVALVGGRSAAPPPHHSKRSVIGSVRDLCEAPVANSGERACRLPGRFGSTARNR